MITTQLSGSVCQTCVAAILAFSRSPFTMAGKLLRGMRIAVVVPPAAAAFVPDRKPVGRDMFVSGFPNNQLVLRNI